MVGGYAASLLKPLQPPWRARENKQTALRAGENRTTAPLARGNAPLLPPAAASAPRESVSRDFQVAVLPYKSRSLATPEGEILAALCFEMLMRTNAERRANFPLRGKWCAAPIGVHFHRAKPGCLVFSGIRENRKMKRSNSCTYLFRDSPFGGWRHHLSPRESMSLDSQSPKGSLRIQFLCHPASGGTTKLCEKIISKVAGIIARVVVPPQAVGQ